MKMLRFAGVLAALAACALAACDGETPPPPTTITNTIIDTLPPPPERDPIVVTSSADSGPGTLREAMRAAQPGDTITFEPDEFPPDTPVSIALQSELPELVQGHVTIDASDAFVILDGENAGEEWTPGLRITSPRNVVRGLLIVGFSGAGIVLGSGATHNEIGGDIGSARGIGIGPLGQGNLSAGNSDGVALIGASDNIIRGNLIGIDPLDQSPMPNRGPGILLTDGAQGNAIGPNNVVAFNGDSGIVIRTSDSTGNKVTQNSIYDNESSAFWRQPGPADRAPNPPIINDFDLATGDVSGVACPSCEIEVFSGDGCDAEFYDAEFFEGAATANSDGTFEIHTGAPLRGPGLTATATVPGPGGSTSTFSAPTSGTSHSVVFQDGNSHPKTFLQTGRPIDLEQNRIGDMFPLDRHPRCPLAEENWDFTHVDLLGFKWVRLSLDRLEWHTAANTGDFSQSEINDCQKQMIDLLLANDVTIVYTLVHWDEELHADRPPNYGVGGEEDIDRFLEYTATIVELFEGRIQYYEILNEGIVFDVLLDDYVDLITAAEAVIHAEDPDAKIMAGGASNLFYPDSKDYVLRLAESSAMSLVDSISLHPMYGSSPAYSELEDYYYGYDEFIRLLQHTADTADFSGEFFAEEMAWRMPFNVNEDEYWVYSEPVAAKYYARGIVINRGLGLYAGLGGEGYDTVPEIVRVIQSLTATMAGAEPTDGPPVDIEPTEGLPVDIEMTTSRRTPEPFEGLPMDIETTTFRGTPELFRTRSYWFSLSDGDLLLALWQDGEAVDDDPGIPSTVTISGFTADGVTGIDILYGFEQQLDTQDEDGDLVIHNLLLKDYPMFLRFSGVTISP